MPKLSYIEIKLDEVDFSDKAEVIRAFDIDRYARIIARVNPQILTDPDVLAAALSCAYADFRAKNVIDRLKRVDATLLENIDFVTVMMTRRPDIMIEFMPQEMLCNPQIIEASLEGFFGKRVPEAHWNAPNISRHFFNQYAFVEEFITKYPEAFRSGRFCYTDERSYDARDDARDLQRIVQVVKAEAIKRGIKVTEDPAYECYLDMHGNKTTTKGQEVNAPIAMAFISPIIAQIMKKRVEVTTDARATEVRAAPVVGAATARLAAKRSASIAGELTPS